MTQISKLLLATSVSLSDQIILDQGNPPVTRRAPLSALSPLIFTINFQTGLNYNAVLTDSLNTLVEMNNASSNTMTIQQNSVIAFPVGSCLLLAQYGLGISSFFAGAGVTLLLASTAQCRAKNSIIGAIQVLPNVWQVCGDML